MATLKGFRDFSPQDMTVRRYVIEAITHVFQKYGFSELQTPTLEYQEVLLGKYGEEAEKLMYLFEDAGERKVGLKYDLTVPLARYMSDNQNTPLPFKRYQIQPVFRAENTQKGRYRELFQCDADIVGIKNPLADAEILAVISDCLDSLKFPEFTVQINSRTVLFEIMERAGIERTKWMSAIQSIDKLDKKTTLEVQEEMSKKGFSAEQIVSIFTSLKTAAPDVYLNEVLEIAQKLGVKNVQFNPSISRGLDYYDGPIFETIVHEPKIGSITGGGRYDGLMKMLGGPDLPAVGTTIGLERIIDVMTNLSLVDTTKTNQSKVLVTIFATSLATKSLEVAESLRESGINTEIYLDDHAKMDKQFKYADKKQIPYVAIVGPDEVSRGVVKFKNMQSGEEKEVPTSEVPSFFE